MIKPILFNTEMVQAILDERNTATRRIVKLPKYIEHEEDGTYTLYAEGCVYENQHMEEIIPYIKKPYKVGDILWVRETWNKGYELDGNEQIIDGTDKYFYAAGPNDVLPNFTYWLNTDTGEHMDHMTWKPSIHMPKEAARIFLKVTDVRVEKVQDITNEECLKEGATGDKCNHESMGEHGCTDCMNTGWIYPPIADFAELWDSKTKEEQYKFASNPYVWVIEFEHCEKPEDF
jgi:hypothetical protein